MVLFAREADAYAPILPAFVLDFHHRELTDFGCRTHVRAATRLQVDVAYPNQPQSDRDWRQALHP